MQQKKTTRSKNSIPKDTKSHPWRKANSNLKNYTQKSRLKAKEI